LRKSFWLGFKVERRGFAQVDAGGNTYRSLALVSNLWGRRQPVDLFALFSAIASIFGGGGTVAPDATATLTVNKS
jgi:hypothetical protein